MTARPGSFGRAGGKLRAVELLIAVNPDPDSRLPYLMRLPLGGGMVFRTSGTWPRTKALYCYPAPAHEWPADPDIVERVGLRSCVRRGAAIDLILDRGRENRSQLVFTTARGRDAVFWQSPRTRKQARPDVRTPTARAAGIADLEIVADSHEQYPYRFGGQQATVLRRALPCGDYGVIHHGRLVVSVERKSLTDLVASLTSGKLRYALAEMAALPRAAVVVEDRYSAIFKLDRVRPALVADGLAEVQVRWPNVPIVFCETRQLAEEWTYRFLAAARVWAETEEAALGRIMPATGSPPPGSPASTRLPPLPDRRPPRSVPGRAPRAFPFRTAASSAPRSGTPGAPRPPRKVNERGALPNLLGREPHATGRTWWCSPTRPGWSVPAGRTETTTARGIRWESVITAAAAGPVPGPGRGHRHPGRDQARPARRPAEHDQRDRLRLSLSLNLSGPAGGR